MKNLDQTYENIDFDRQMLSRDGYDNCTFIKCGFSSSDFADVSFTECHFRACDFSMANMANAGLKDVVFHNCNFIGVNIAACSPFLFKAKFEGCQMDLIRANGMILKGTAFSSCSLKEADFTESDLTSVTFDDCNLDRAIFVKTNLKNTDFNSAYNYVLDPSNNFLNKTIFSTAGIKGLLSPFDIVIKN